MAASITSGSEPEPTSCKYAPCDIEECEDIENFRQIVKTMGELPERWKQTKFKKGYAVAEGEEGGKVFWTLKDTNPLDDPSQSHRRRSSEPVHKQPGPAPPMFEDDAPLREPYPAALSSMVWKPTAVCFDGYYSPAYSDETYQMLAAFPKITGPEASLLVDLLSRIFTYEPEKRITAEELLTHPWFHLTPGL